MNRCIRAWSDAYSTGVEILDQPHQEVYDALTELSKIIGGSGPNRSALGNLNFIRTRLVSHYREEEILLDCISHPDAGTHIKSHKKHHQDSLAMIDYLIYCLEAGCSPLVFQASLDKFTSIFLQELTRYDVDMLGLLAHGQSANHCLLPEKPPAYGPAPIY